MLRGDMWVSKNKVPAVFMEVCDRSFTPALIKEAFRKCGIYPLNRSAIEIEFVKNHAATGRKHKQRVFQSQGE